MQKIYFQITSFYLVFIGTWRLASATKRAPMGDLGQYQEEEEKYKPLWDLFFPHKIVIWMFRTLASFNKPGSFAKAVIMHKKFNWGLLWLMLGIIIQFLSGIIK